MATSMARDPRVRGFITRVAWEQENDKPKQPPAFDEIVTKPVEVHIERMDDGCYWMNLYRFGRSQVVWFNIENGKLIARTE